MTVAVSGLSIIILVVLAIIAVALAIFIAKKVFGNTFNGISVFLYKLKSSIPAWVFVVFAAVVLLIILLIIAAFIFGMPIGKRFVKNEATPVTEAQQLSIEKGDSQYCTVTKDDIVRYSESAYKSYDFETGNNKMTANLINKQVVLEFHLGTKAYYNADEKILYLDFGVDESSNVNGTNEMSVYLISEDVKNDKGVCKVLSGILHPGEKISKIPCEFPSGISTTRMRILVINSRSPQTADWSSLWVADIYQKSVEISYEPFDKGNTDDSGKKEETSNNENKVETPENNVQYPYSIGNVKTDPTDADFEAFYSMVKDLPTIWMASDSFVSANMDVKKLVETYLFDDGMSWGLFSRFAFNSDLITRPEFIGVENGMEFRHARYKASDVDWVLKAVFDVDPDHYGNDQNNAMFFEGDYFYRMAIELHMGAGITDVVTFNPTYEKIDEGVYKFTLDLSTKWEYDDEPPQKHVWQFVASPMHSQNLGTYWRIISFTDIE